MKFDLKKDLARNCYNYARSRGYSSIIQTPRLPANLTMANIERLEPSPFFRKELKIQSQFNEKGYRYLLPHHEMSNLKIFNTINIVSNELDRLIKQCNLDAKHVQKVLNSLFEKKDKGIIRVRTFSTLENQLNKDKIPENFKKMIQNASAVTYKSPKSAIQQIYIRFAGNIKPPAFLNPNGILYQFTSIFTNFHNNSKNKTAKEMIEHELTHALKNLFQNPGIKKVLPAEEIKQASCLFLSLEDALLNKKDDYLLLALSHGQTYQAKKLNKFLA